MKKALLLILCFACSALVAQDSNTNTDHPYKLRSDYKKPLKKVVSPQYTGAEVSQIEAKGKLSTDFNYKAEGDVVGEPVYDLHTNRSMQRRMLLDDDGTLHAVWTHGILASSFTDRGSGYNIRFDGDWALDPADITRLEGNVRTGWPSIGRTESGRLFVISHSAEPDPAAPTQGLFFAYQEALGQPWQDVNIPGDVDATWSRTAFEGDNIFVITSRPNDAPLVADMTSGLNFFRSTDQGDTWDEPIPLDIVGDYFGEVEIDCYDIDINNGVLAFVMGGYARQTVVFKSTDMGDTWEAIPVATTDNPLILDGSSLVEYFEPTTLAETISLVVDSEGKIHVTGSWIYNGQFDQLTDPGAPDASPGFYQDRTGILYWNEDMPAFDLIGNTSLFDWDGDGTDTISAMIDEHWRFYRVNTPVSQPSMGLDEDNNPYVVYSSAIDHPDHFHESGENPERHFREVLIVKGTNGPDGVSWEGPYNVSQDPDTEDVWAYLPRKIRNGEVNIMYNSDLEPGDALPLADGSAGEHSPVANDIRVVTIDADDIVTPDYDPETNPPHLGLFWTAWPTSEGCVLTPGQVVGLEAWDFPDGFLTDQIVMPDIDYTTVAQGVPGMMSVTDSDGNTVELEFNVNVLEDVEDPEITLLCPAGEDCNELSYESSDEEWVDPGYEIFDDSQCPGLENNVVISGDEVDLSQSGIYEVIYTITDFAGNSTSVTRTVSVAGEDGIDPTISVVLNNVQAGDQENYYTYEGDPNAETIIISATDENADIYLNVEDNITISPETSIEPSEVDPGVLGPTPIAVTAMDDAGNSVDLSFILDVVDTTAPILAPKAGASTAISGCIDPDGNTTVEEFPESDWNITDNFSESVTIDRDFGSLDLNNPVAGEYDVIYTAVDLSGNVSDAYPIKYTLIDCDENGNVLGVEDIALANAIKLTPNPSNGLIKLILSSDYQNANVVILDVQGKEIKNIKNVSGTTPLNLLDVAAGTYFVKVSTNNAMAVKQIIIE